MIKIIGDIIYWDDIAVADIRANIIPSNLADFIKIIDGTGSSHIETLEENIEELEEEIMRLETSIDDLKERLE